MILPAEEDNYDLSDSYSEMEDEFAQFPESQAETDGGVAREDFTPWNSEV